MSWSMVTPEAKFRLLEYITLEVGMTCTIWFILGGYITTRLL